MYTSGGLYWALSTLNPGNSPLLSAVTLRLSVTLSLHGPGVVSGERVGDDLSRIGQEVVRIQGAYTGRVNMAVRQDIAFGAVLSSQPVWRGLIREDTVV